MLAYFFVLCNLLRSGTGIISGCLVLSLAPLGYMSDMQVLGHFQNLLS